MSKTPGTLTSENFDRIWLEPREGADPYIGRQWCQDNQWGEDGIEYVRADLVALQSATEAPPPSTHGLPSSHLDEARAIIGYLLDRHHIAPCLPVESVGVMQRFMASALAATAREDGR